MHACVPPYYITKWIVKVGHEYPCSQAVGETARYITYESTNSYFHCQKVGYTNQISDVLSHDKSKAELCHALKCHSHTHSISAQLH